MRMNNDILAEEQSIFNGLPHHDCAGDINTQIHEQVPGTYFYVRICLRKDDIVIVMKYNASNSTLGENGYAIGATRVFSQLPKI